MKKFLITGGNFINKGAESMMYVTVDEIRKRFPDAEIYYMSHENVDMSDFAFEHIYVSPYSKTIALGGIKGLIRSIQSTCFEIVKTVLRKNANIKGAYELKKILPTISVILDISGFNLGKKWSVSVQEDYLDNIRLAKKYNIPMYLMPQSFGPFDYNNPPSALMHDCSELLKYPRIVFARESEGKSQLERHFGLENVKLSTDLVLQNTGVNYENIYKNKVLIKEFDIAANSVGVVTNKQCFDRGNLDELIELYKSIITYLLGKGRTIYLIRHSKQDLESCKLIKNVFLNCDKVVLFEKELSCVEYEELVKKFDFIICSRFHGIVHAYRNNIPAIALGWAIKYQELLHNVGQDGYYFDITSSKLNIEEIISAVEKISENNLEERRIILENVEEIQNENCFTLFEKDFMSL